MTFLTLFRGKWTPIYIIGIYIKENIWPHQAAVETILSFWREREWEILNKLLFLQMSLVEPVEQVTETRDHSLYRSFVMRDAYRCVLQFSGPNNLKCNFSPVSFLLLPEAR